MTFVFTVKRNPPPPIDVGIEFEAGSCEEAAAILLEESNGIGRLYGAMVAAAAADSQPVDESTGEASGGPDATGGKRKRRTKAEMAADEAAAKLAVAAPPPPPDAAIVAVAPPPMPVPAGDVDMPLTDPKHPLYRAPPAAAVAAPPPPPPPPTAPAAVAPPQCTLAPKVIENLKARVAGGATEASLIAWLANPCLLVHKTSTWDEAIAALQFTDDAKLAPTAQSLGIS